MNYHLTQEEYSVWERKGALLIMPDSRHRAGADLGKPGYIAYTWTFKKKKVLC